jgi:hypothetical protein
MTNHQYGPKGHIVDAFFEHLKQMTKADWLAVSAAWYAARDTAGYGEWYTAINAAWEILGADLLRERGQPFFFLPMFGFADEQAIIKQESI